MREGETVYVPLCFGVNQEEVREILGLSELDTSAKESPNEVVFDFIKPHVLPMEALKARTDFRVGVQRAGGNFSVLAHGRTPQLSKEFWEGHYGYLIEKHKGGRFGKMVETLVPQMIGEFSSKYGQGIWWEVLLGREGLCKTSREVLGDKLKPAPGTIRANYMVAGDAVYNTVMHVSDLGRVQVELENFAENGIKDLHFGKFLEGLVF